MGVQLVSEKKTREAASMTGLALIRVLRHSNRYWFGFVRRGKGHWHVAIDPVTWEWTTETESAFSSCEKYGDHVDPPEGLRLMAVKAALAKEDHDRAERLTRALGFYAAERTYELGPNVVALAGLSLESHVPIIDDKGALARAALAAEED